jgi:predicted nucleotidyltransferase
MNLKQKITDNLPSTPVGVEVFLFGSILTSECVNDIDLAIIYDKSKLGLKEAVELRSSLRKHIGGFTDIYSEIVLLSRQENDEMEFTQNIRTEKII